LSDCAYMYKVLSCCKETAALKAASLFKPPEAAAEKPYGLAAGVCSCGAIWCMRTIWHSPK